MKKALIASMVAAASLAIGGAALAGNGGNGNGFPSGPHYNLEIIGGTCKNSTMTGGNQHTIFVPLGSKTEKATSNIYLCQGPTFAVLDGNACDAARGCGLNGKTGAVFQLPCDTLQPDGTISDCSASNGEAAYCVYAEALGTPGGSSQITTCATDPGTGQVVCSTNPTPVLLRSGGKPHVYNVTTQLTTLTCTAGTSNCPCASGTCTYEIFDSALQDFYWQYDNKGLRNAQLRFYLEPNYTSIGSCDL